MSQFQTSKLKLMILFDQYFKNGKKQSKSPNFRQRPQFLQLLKGELLKRLRLILINDSLI